MNEVRIDTIDFSAFMEFPENGSLSDLTEEQRRVARQIDKAFREEGFLKLENFGLTENELSTTFGLCQQLFSKPRAEKIRALKGIDRESNTGYVPYGLESLNSRRSADRKEAYNFRHDADWSQDFRECPPGFDKATKTLWEKLVKVAHKFSVACAVALGLPPDGFRKHMNRTDNTTMRLIHYPPCDFSEESCGQNETSSLRVGEHTDFGLFTILFTDGPGLQIKPVEGAEFREQQSKDKSPWLDVVPPKGVTAIVNTGALLARWTNDEWRATAHRVVVQDKEQASRSRYTIVAFFDPDKEAVISVDPKFVRPGEEPKYGPITGLDYLLMRLAEAQGPGKGKEQIIAAP